MSGNTRETYQPLSLSGKEGIADLYNRYGKKLYGYAVYTWSFEEDAAWDLVYKTLYKVLDSYKKYTFESEEKFASFIFKIGINYLRNAYRDNKKQGLVFSDFESAEMGNIPEPPVPEADRNARLKILREELDQMEDWQRMLLLMRSDGKPYAEISAYIDKPEEQLKVYYQRLKQHITKKINERL